MFLLPIINTFLFSLTNSCRFLKSVFSPYMPRSIMWIAGNHTEQKRGILSQKIHSHQGFVKFKLCGGSNRCGENACNARASLHRCLHLEGPGTSHRDQRQQKSQNDLHFYFKFRHGPCSSFATTLVTDQEI